MQSFAFDINNYEVLICSAATDTPGSCPVCAILCILQHGLCPGLLLLHPVAIVANLFDQCGYSYGTGSAYTKWLQSITVAVYSLPKNDPAIAKWGTHSIRVTAANLLHCAQFSSSFIKNCLRWHRDTFQMYLRNTFYIADKHSKSLAMGIAPPTPIKHQHLEPHKVIPATLMA